MNPTGERVVTILHVDDTAATRFVVTQVLRDAGFDVIEAQSGADALCLLGESPDLALLDVNLPDMAPHELCRRIRDDPRARTTPLVHLTGTCTSAEDHVHALERCVDAYLTHPVDARVLIATIRALLRARDAERELRRSHALLRAVVEGAYDAITVKDRDGRYVLCNEARARLAKTVCDELLGKTDADVLPPAEAAAIRRADLRVMSSGRPETLEQPTTIGGQVRTFLCSKAPYRDDAGDVAGVVTVLFDISDRKREEEQRERLLADLHAAEEAREDLLRMITHDLKEPLGAVALRAQVLLRAMESGRAAPSPREMVAGMMRDIDEAAAMIDQILVASDPEVEAHRETPPIDLADVAGDVVRRLAPQATAAGCAIRLSASRALGRWDRTRIEAVVRNLVANAIKYGGGRAIDVAVEDREGLAVLVVRDEGPGIAAEDQARIFERFQRGARAEADGHGLGLWIARRIVEAHGGAIRVDSRPGAGSTFTVTLQCEREQAAARMAPGSLRPTPP